MDILLLFITVLFCALQAVTKKAFGAKIKGGGTYFFAAFSSLFAMLFFIVTADGLSFNCAILPYSLGFGLAYLTSLVPSYLALTTGSASLSTLISSYSLMIPAFYGLVFLREPMGKFFLPGLLILLISIFLIYRESRKLV